MEELNRKGYGIKNYLKKRNLDVEKTKKSLGILASRGSESGLGLCPLSYATQRTTYILHVIEAKGCSFASVFERFG